MTKRDDALSLLELISDPTTEDVIRIATKVGCSERTVWRALKDSRKSLECHTDNTKKPIPKSTHKPSPPLENTSFINDPDELLMSVAVRELNKPAPDPRWANILINCKKENITIKNEMLEQFKQLPTKALVSLLNKNSPEEL
jgi:hypothetical protein